MSLIEKKLAEYRAKKEQNANHKSNSKDFNKDCKLQLQNSEICSKNCENTVKDSSSEMESLNGDDAKLINCTYVDVIYYSLTFVLWIIVYMIFIKLEFGTVYLVLSILIGIYFNTRTGPKKLGEVSAYSVFNKNCKSIDGTLKAEQFEREIRYGGLR